MVAAPSAPVTMEPDQTPSSPSPGATATPCSVHAIMSGEVACPQWQFEAQVVRPGTYW